MTVIALPRVMAPKELSGYFSEATACCWTARSCTKYSTKSRPADAPKPEVVEPTCVGDPCSVAALGPVGSGCGAVQRELTEDMRQVAREALELYRTRKRQKPTEFHELFLTRATLANYIEPVASQHLARALERRDNIASILQGEKPLYLGSPSRVIGWDQDGCSLVMVEPGLLKSSLGSALTHIEYTVWTAMDLNKPGANEFVVIVDLGSGFNPLHFLNPGPLIALAGALEGQWRRRMKATLLIDVPPAFQKIIDLFMSMIKPSTRERIRSVSAEEAVDALRAMGCDDETMASAERCIDERRRKTKPAYHPIVDCSFFRERLANFNMGATSEYASPAFHQALRRVVAEWQIHKWGTGVETPIARQASSSSSSGPSMGAAREVTLVWTDVVGPTSEAEAPLKSLPSDGSDINSADEFVEDKAADEPKSGHVARIRQMLARLPRSCACRSPSRSV
mmetsp:Transcript_12919/g.33232  ORF Transcript_12919/g.33232 Transcript_12919/m.33232 type:complete len:453 (-) Transcript_12919:168-1526(-)